MSTSAQPETPSNVSGPSGTSPSPAASGGTLAASQPSEWRVPDTDPRPWARGKTANEILGLTEKLNEVVTNYVTTGQQQQQQQPQYPQQQYQPGQYQMPAQQQPGYDPDAYIQRRELENLAPQVINQTLAPQFALMHQNIAQTNLASVQRDNAAIFQKYGPEINSYLAKVPFEQRSVDNLNTIVDIVRGKHVDELASEIASQRNADQGMTLRSNGSPAPPAASNELKYTLQSDQLPPDWKDRAAKMGLTEAAVDEWCRVNEITRAEFFKQFAPTAITERRA